MADEWTWRVERDKFSWHPLYKYVDGFLTLLAIASYRVGLYEPSENDKKGYLKLKEDCGIDYKNFNSLLEFAKDLYEGKYNDKNPLYYHNLSLIKYLKIFEPLTITTYGSLVLFKYSKYIELNELGYSEEDFFNLDGGLYRECRSVVFDIQGDHGVDIVLAPQPKFFNVNENEEWSDKHIRQLINNSEKIEITNKLDGSNQNYRWYKGRVVGSGSQALNTEESWRLTDGYRLLGENYINMLKDYPEWTFMFEYISPKNCIVVNYTQEQEGLYLFGMRNVWTGKQLLYEEVLEIGNKYGVKCTEVYNTTYDNILNSVDNYTCNEKEGWVIGIKEKNGNIFKAKLKVTDYVIMHKAISKMVSPNAIIQSIAEDKWDDFYAKLPLGFKDIAHDIAIKVFHYLFIIDNKTQQYYNNYKYLENKKDFMIACEKDVPRDVKKYVRNLYLGQENNYITENIKAHYIKLKEIEEFLERNQEE